MWAAEVWPYINGKALANNIRLGEMEASEMMDVLHFYMEEDITYASAEVAESRSNTRVGLYRELYGVEYKYPYTSATKSKIQNLGSGEYASDSTYALDDLDGDQPFDPRNSFEPANKPPMKPPLQPPTVFDPDAANPFPGLDAPLN